MKRCRNCGAELTEGTLYCASCGAAQEASQTNNSSFENHPQEDFQNSQWNTSSDQQYYQNNQWNNGQQQYGQNQWNSNQQQYSQNQWNSNQQQPGQNQWGSGQQQYNQWNQPTGANTYYQPMKWYKFIIYFQLFAAMALNTLSGISAFTGAQYDGEADLVYRVFEGLKTVDILMGVACILLAVGDLVARQKLSGFKRDAIQWYLGVMAATVVVSVIYIIAVCAITEMPFMDAMKEGNFRGSLWMGIVMLAINYTYFQKRRDMFCN